MTTKSTTRGHYLFACKDFPSVYRLCQTFAGDGSYVKEFGEDEADALARMNKWVRPKAREFLGFDPGAVTARAYEFRPLNIPKKDRTP